MFFPTSDEKSSQEVMFEEAVQAIRGGDRARGKDLLVRLLQQDKANATYWVWMSTAVETKRERLECLKRAYEIDPQNAAAKRGLVIFGALPPDKTTILPAQLQKRNWQQQMESADNPNTEPALSRRQIALMGTAALALIALVALAIFGAQLQRRSNTRVAQRPTYTAVLEEVTPTPTEFVVPKGSPTPLWMLIQATFTPTPLYVNTPHSVSEAYRIGVRSLQRGDWTGAQNYFRQAATDVARSDPAARDVLYYIGENYRQQGELEEALEIFEQVIQDAPEFAPGYVGRARTRLAQSPDRAIPQAIQDLQTALSLDAGYTEAYVELAGLQITAGTPEQALETLDRGREVVGTLPLANLYRAQAFMALDRPEEALASARTANEADPTLLLAYRLLGEALQKTGSMVESLEPLRLYLIYEPDDALAWYALAQAYLAEEDSPSALEALERGMALDNRQPGAYLLRAQLYYELDEMEKALEDYQAAVRQDPNSYTANLGLGMTLMAVEEPGSAWDRFERTRALAETEAQQAEVLYWRAQSLDALGETAAAMRDYQTLLALPDGNTQPHWKALASRRIAALATVTPTVTAPTRTSTKAAPSSTPSRTPTPARTRTPTRRP